MKTALLVAILCFAGFGAAQKADAGRVHFSFSSGGYYGKYPPSYYHGRSYYRAPVRHYYYRPPVRHYYSAPRYSYRGGGYCR
ncbi:MAG: hypothetical protein AAF555_06820 [Verrucomicrobiota bacterium]